jgi:hypothetical protein
VGEIQRDVKDGPKASLDRVLAGEAATDGVPGDFRKRRTQYASTPSTMRKMSPVMARTRIDRCGFDIRIQPLANLVRSDRHGAYGIVATATHEELHRLYSQDWVGSYLPEPVLVETRDGKWRAALCYVAPAQEPRPAISAYIDRIVGPAREYGFPDWYVARLESFRPQ